MSIKDQQITNYKINLQKSTIYLVIESESCSAVSDSVTPWIYSPWNSPGQKTGEGTCSLLQRIFPTEGSN